MTCYLGKRFRKHYDLSSQVENTDFSVRKQDIVPMIRWSGVLPAFWIDCSMACRMAFVKCSVHKNELGSATALKEHPF